MPAPTVLARIFRAVAIAEACSWTGLLIGMVFKYLVVFDDVGVKIFGPIHGGLFVAYVGFLNVGFFTFTTKADAKNGDTVQATPGLAVMNNPTIWLFIIGLFLAIILTVLKVRGGMLFTGSIPVITDSTQPRITDFSVPRAREHQKPSPHADRNAGDRS